MASSRLSERLSLKRKWRMVEENILCDSLAFTCVCTGECFAGAFAHMHTHAQRDRDTERLREIERQREITLSRDKRTKSWWMLHATLCGNNSELQPRGIDHRAERVCVS